MTPPTLSPILPPHHKTFVYILSNDPENEWDDDRSTHGDDAFHNAMLSIGNIPPSHITIIRDPQYATRSNATEKFMNLLKRTTVGSTLVFYYGGHGGREYFCTEGEKWPHREVVRLVRDYFKGDTVWFNIDCCYAGNFHEAVVKVVGKTNNDASSSSLSDKRGVTYVCFMSSPIDETSVSAWCLTKCWVDAMNGDIIKDKYYDHRSCHHVTVRDLAEYLVDEHMRVKKDIFTSFVMGPECNTVYQRVFVPTESETMCRWEWFVGGCRRLFSLFCPVKYSTDYEMSSVRKQRAVSNVSMGTVVYAKWKGGHVAPSPSLSSSSGDGLSLTGYVMPAWFRGTIVNPPNDDHDDDAIATVELHDPMTSLSWTCHVSLGELLPDNYFQKTTMEDFLSAQTAMAKYCRYVSYSIPPGTSILARWWEEDIKSYVEYRAQILAWQDYNWLTITQDWCRRMYSDGDDTDDDAVIGPYVPVEWIDEDTYSLIPISDVRSVCHHFERDDYIAAQIVLARYCRYVSYSIPAQTRVRARWWEEDESMYVSYRARVVPWKDMNWRTVTDESCRRDYDKDVIGAFVPVEWVEEGAFSVIPLNDIVGVVR